MKKQGMTALLVIAAYIAMQMLADVASLKIVVFWGLSMDAGTLVYPFTFTLRDLAHKTVGIEKARAVVIIAAIINLFMAGLFALVAWMPGDPAVGPQTEFARVLAPVWRITLASIVAEVSAELTDTEIYRLWVERVTHRYEWARVLTSNAISVPLDSMLFAWGAFGGVFPAVVVWSIVASNVLVKGAVTLLSLPGIYLVREAA